MKLKNLEKWLGNAVLAASVAVTVETKDAQAAENVSEKTTVVSESRTPTEREARIIAVSAVLVEEFTTNATRMAKLMTPKAKSEWASFCRDMILDGNQYFLPDFFKVKYTFIGGTDADSFVLGVYSPFYDAFMLMRVRDGEKVPKIASFRVATVARLRGLAKIPEFPPSAGCNEPTKYVAVLSAQVRRAGEAFHAEFLGSTAPASVEAFAVSPASECAALQSLLKARLGLLATVATDTRVKANAVLADLVLRDVKFGGKSFVSADKSTKKVLEALAKLPVQVRKDVQFVSYFEAGKSSNFLFMIPAAPTTLVQANVRDGRIWLKMFDARLVNDKRLAAK